MAFKSSVRTNNDVEGWHNRLNRQTRNGKLDVYQLALVLNQETQFVSVQDILVQEDRRALVELTDDASALFTYM